MTPQDDLSQQPSAEDAWLDVALRAPDPEERFHADADAFTARVMSSVAGAAAAPDHELLGRLQCGERRARQQARAQWLGFGWGGAIGAALGLVLSALATLSYSDVAALSWRPAAVGVVMVVLAVWAALRDGLG